jgi:hypothetical protein
MLDRPGMTLTATRAIALATLVTGCAARAPALQHPVGYVCEEASLVDDGQHLAVTDARDPAASRVQLGWSDDAGRHYVHWPTAVTDAQSTEYVVPHDRRADVIVRRYDTRPGTSKQDWLLLHTSACTPRGGYTDALTRFAGGATLEDIRQALLLADVAAARALVHDAMLALQRRYAMDD